jgi:hypothetical protein
MRQKERTCSGSVQNQSRTAGFVRFQDSCDTGKSLASAFDALRVLQTYLHFRSILRLLSASSDNRFLTSLALLSGHFERSSHLFSRSK